MRGGEMRKFGFIAIILTLILAIGGVDAFAQTKKTTRKKPALRKTTTTKVPVKPAIKLYTVAQGKVIWRLIN